MKRQRQSIMDRLRRSLHTFPPTTKPAKHAPKRRANSAPSETPRPNLQPAPEKKAIFARGTVGQHPSTANSARPNSYHHVPGKKPTGQRVPPVPLKTARLESGPSKRIRPVTTVGIITAPGTPTKSEVPVKKTSAFARVVEQQSTFISEQQNIIFKLIEQMERMDGVLRSQRQMISKIKPLPRPPAQSKSTCTHDMQTGSSVHSSRTPDAARISAPFDYLAATPRSSCSPLVSLESDESASALDRIAEEIADTYDALSVSSQYDCTASKVPFFEGLGPSSPEVRPLAFTTHLPLPLGYDWLAPPVAAVSPPLGYDCSAPPTTTAPSPRHQSRLSYLLALNRNYDSPPPPKALLSSECRLYEEPESPVLPHIMGELTPPLPPPVVPGPSPLAPCEARKRPPGALIPGK
jgi:hypothetical protein